MLAKYFMRLPGGPLFSHGSSSEGGSEVASRNRGHSEARLSYARTWVYVSWHNLANKANKNENSARDKSFRN
jgi:hypothetical protein